MTSRHRPTHGADSAEAWNPQPWIVTMADRFDEDFRFTVRVDAAIGQHDAISQARDLRPEGSPLKANPQKEGHAR